MSQIAAKVAHQLEIGISASLLTPAVLLSNTLVLFALDLGQGIPGWIKWIAAMFLAF
jgi:hypothetical protein